MDKAWAEAALRSCNYSITVKRGPPHLQRKKREAPPALGSGGAICSQSWAACR